MGLWRRSVSRDRVEPAEAGQVAIREGWRVKDHYDLSRGVFTADAIGGSVTPMTSTQARRRPVQSDAVPKFVCRDTTGLGNRDASET